MSKNNPSIDNALKQEVHGEYPGLPLDELQAVLNDELRPNQPAVAAPPSAKPNIMLIHIRAKADLALNSERVQGDAEIKAAGDVSLPQLGWLISIIPTAANQIKRLMNREQ
jgi:hypothetical protein